jgi:hypothetical protein
MGWSLAGGQLSGSEQQRITGQEDPDEQPCFGDRTVSSCCAPARPLGQPDRSRGIGPGSERELSRDLR